MTQLEKLKLLLENPPESDDVLTFYLDCAKEIICERRNANEIESQYSMLQVKIAIELFSKRGAEGQLSHNENGIARTYTNSDISFDLLNQITPMVKTPFSETRVVIP